MAAGGRLDELRVDRTQRGWAIASLIFLTLSVVVYAIYATAAVEGPQGGSAIGLAFGALGFAFMVFAALLGARRRVPTWRLGRAQAWMRAHLWLGLLSLPMILFHGGFHVGGALTRILMLLLIVTVASGVFGAVLQHYLPRVMTTDVKLETIYDEIGNVRLLLCEEADGEMEALCGPLGLAIDNASEAERAGGFSAARPKMARSGGPAVAIAVGKRVLTEAEYGPLRKFYVEELRPFLRHPREQRGRLSDADRARAAFLGLRTLLPALAHETLGDLEHICDEARQLLRQEQLHRWLHGWLLLHIPLSLSLIVLGTVHAVAALRW